MELFKVGEPVEVMPIAFKFIKNYQGPKMPIGVVERIVKDEVFIRLGPFHRAWVRSIYLRPAQLEVNI